MVDGERSGRPKEIREDIENSLLANIRGSRSGREKSSEILAYKANISFSSALRILRKYNLHSIKPTSKCGLTAAMCAACLEFYLVY